MVLENLPHKARFSDSRATTISNKKKTANKVILLTGATGYLGSRILSYPVKDPTVSEIHCVAVRKDATGQVLKLPITSTKIIIYNGDLTTPRLGLSEAEADSLSQSADAIIHCGAKRSFWDNYEQLRDTNVNSTKKIVELAAPRKIPIHFMSSGGVLQLGASPNRTEDPGSVNVQPPLDGSNGYVASRWASETYLQNAAAVLGTPVFIYRFTPSQSGIQTHLRCAGGAVEILAPRKLASQSRGLERQLRSCES